MKQFVADASHELRTPLAVVRGYSELSLRLLQQLSVSPDKDDTSILADTVSSSLERIHSQSLRMTRLVEELPLLARLNEGEEGTFKRVNLTQVVIDSVSDVQQLAPGYLWEMEIPNDEVIVMGDLDRLC